MELEPIDPETALELYLAEKKAEFAKATHRSHCSRLGHFVRWCDERDITNLNELTGRAGFRSTASGAATKETS